MSECLFCEIIAHRVPATFVAEDEQVVAIRDVNPQAPTHVLILPREHIASAADLTPAHDRARGHMLHVAQKIAIDEGIAASGYRLVTNVGHAGGQTVAHLHIHLLGGRQMSWPPG